MATTGRKKRGQKRSAVAPKKTRSGAARSAKTPSLDSLLAAVSADPEDVNAALNLAKYYNAGAQDDKAIETLRPLEELYPFGDKGQRVRYNRLLGFSYANVGNLAEAEIAIQRGLTEAPESLDFHYIECYTRLSLREYDDTIRAGQAYLLLLERHLRQNAPLTDLAGSNGHLSQLHNFIGAAYREKNDFEKAVRHYHEAVKADPGNHLPYINLATVARHHNDIETARKVIEQGLTHCRQVQELRMLATSLKRRATISACMIVKDEEELLPGCLDSVRDWVNEIIVVDTGSTDRTIEIARSYGAKIYHQPWEGNFSKHRNYSIELANSDWIFIIDADERFDQKDVPALLDAISSKEIEVIAINVFNNMEIDHKVTLANSIRFFRRETNIRYEGIVHNSPRIPKDLTITRAPFSLEHLGYNLSREKMKKKFERTKALLEKQLEDDPDFAFAWFNLAQLLRGELKYSFDEYAPQVLKAAHRAVELTNPVDSDTRLTHLMALNLLAWTYFYSDDYENAERFANRALETKRDYLDPLMLLGHIYSKTEKYDETIQSYKKYLEVQANYDAHREIDSIILDHPESLEIAYFGIGSAAELNNDLKTAKEYYLKIIETKPGYLETAFHLGRIYLAENNLIQAEKYFLMQLDTNIQSAPAALGLVTIYYQQKQNSKAEKFFLKALEIEPENQNNYILAGEFNYETENYEKALSYYKKAESLGNISNDTKRIMAELHFKLEQFDKAAQIYEQLLNENPDSSDFLNDLANCNFKMSNYDEAERYYLKAIETGKANAITFQNLGLNRINQGKIKEAIINLEKYLELIPDKIEIENLLADLNFQTGEYKSAIEYYEKVLIKMPENVQVIFNLSESYLHMGHGDSAILGYQRVLQVDRNFKPAQKRLADLAEPAGRA